MKAIILTIIMINICFAEDFYKTRIFFNQDLQQPNPQCVNHFVNLVKTSSYDFKVWSANKDEKWTKEHLSFLFDTWNDEEIVAKLFFDSKSEDFQGTNTITWIRFDIRKQILQDSIQEVDLRFDKILADKLESCLNSVVGNRQRWHISASHNFKGIIWHTLAYAQI